MLRQRNEINEKNGHNQRWRWRGWKVVEWKATIICSYGHTHSSCTYVRTSYMKWRMEKNNKRIGLLTKSNKDRQGWQIALISKCNPKIKYRIIGGYTQHLYVSVDVDAMHMWYVLHFHFKCSCAHPPFWMHATIMNRYVAACACLPASVQSMYMLQKQRKHTLTHHCIR